jgi:hypothetical protein
MSDFPIRGDVVATRTWLDKEGFENFLVGWKADAVMGLEKADLLHLVPGDDGLKLWSLLNTAKSQPPGKAYFLRNIDYIPHDSYT